MMGVCDCCIEYRRLAPVTDQFGTICICADCKALRDEVERDRRVLQPATETRS